MNPGRQGVEVLDTEVDALVEGAPVAVVEVGAGADVVVAAMQTGLPAAWASCKAARVWGPTTPSTVRPLACWKLLAVVGCGALTAAKVLGETAGVDRFKSAAAFARHIGTAVLPVWSSNHARHRLSRVGNRQLNAALHRIALTQVHWHPPAKELYSRRRVSQPRRGTMSRTATLALTEDQLS
jgi:transposase